MGRAKERWVKQWREGAVMVLKRVRVLDDGGIVVSQDDYSC